MENVHPNYEKRMQLLQDTLNCRKTDRVMAAPFYTYLPILLYGGNHNQRRDRRLAECASVLLPIP